jgi:hypothetical protein
MKDIMSPDVEDMAARERPSGYERRPVTYLAIVGGVEDSDIAAWPALEVAWETQPCRSSLTIDAQPIPLRHHSRSMEHHG